MLGEVIHTIHADLIQLGHAQMQHEGFHAKQHQHPCTIATNATITVTVTVTVTNSITGTYDIISCLISIVNATAVIDSA